MDRSELAQNVGANNLAESFMAFNTHYRDSGLFGIYAVAKVCGLFKTVLYVVCVLFITVLHYIGHVMGFHESSNHIYHVLFSRLCLQFLSHRSAKWSPFNIE